MRDTEMHGRWPHITYTTYISKMYARYMPIRLTQTGDDGKFETCVQPMYIMIVDFSVINFLVRNSDE